MKLLLLILLVAAGVTVAADAPAFGLEPASPHVPSTADRPNIVVILSDDAGYREFSMQGAKLFPTPHIDSIAAGGVHCTCAYTSGCVCSPTRAGLLTGRYQNRFGHEFNFPQVENAEIGLPVEETTLADLLHGAGYRTIAIGKWHLGYAEKFHPLSRGFTDYYGFLAGSRSYFPLPTADKLNRMMRNREYVRPEKFNYLTDELSRAAAEYIANSKDKPFFLYLALNATHSPNDALPTDLTQLKGDGGNRKHRAMTIALDRAVGTVLSALKERQLQENTLVFFLNDNGGAGGHDNGPLRSFKGSAWEGGIRVPFAVQWPAVLPQGTVFKAPVISLDIFATAVAAAGIKAPRDRPLDGVNLLPFLTGADKHRPHPTLYWKNGRAWAVRDGDLKLVKGLPKEPAVELFDLSVDESESHNLATDRPEEVRRLSRLYDDWRKDFPPPKWGSGAKPKG